MYIDLLVEKYLTSIKKWGHIVDIYENPTPSEVKEIDDDMRFIADATNKKIYMWSAMTAIHADIWEKVLKPKGETRKLYKSGDVLTGEITKNKKMIALDAYYSMPDTVRKSIREQDWSFVKQFDLQEYVGRLTR